MVWQLLSEGSPREPYLPALTRLCSKWRPAHTCIKPPNTEGVMQWGVWTQPLRRLAAAASCFWKCFLLGAFGHCKKSGCSAGQTPWSAPWEGEALRQPGDGESQCRPLSSGGSRPSLHLTMAAAETLREPRQPTH